MLLAANNVTIRLADTAAPIASLKSCTIRVQTTITTARPAKAEWVQRCFTTMWEITSPQFGAVTPELRAAVSSRATVSIGYTLELGSEGTATGRIASDVPSVVAGRLVVVLR